MARVVYEESGRETYELAGERGVFFRHQLGDDARPERVGRGRLRVGERCCFKSRHARRTRHEEAPLGADLEIPEAPGLREVRLRVEVWVGDGSEALSWCCQSRVSRSASLRAYLVLFLDGAAVRVGLRMASAYAAV